MRPSHRVYCTLRLSWDPSKAKKEKKRNSVSAVIVCSSLAFSCIVDRSRQTTRVPDVVLFAYHGADDRQHCATKPGRLSILADCFLKMPTPLPGRYLHR